MTPLIHQVARAIAYGHFEAEGYPAQDLPAMADECWLNFQLSARRALEAIREPTPEMVEAGAKAASTTPLPHTARTIWQAMIDAALNEATTEGQ